MWLLAGVLLCAALRLPAAHAHGGHAHGGGGGGGGGGGHASNVVELTSTNFDELVGQDKAVVMDFYAPWCGHCKTLRPELEKLATTFLDSDEVLIAKLNGEAFPEYSYRFGVRGFPTIFWFPARADKPSQEYWGDRHAAALMNWIHTKLEEPNPLKDEPDEPPPDFDLTGTWVDQDGGEMDVKQDKAVVTAKPKQPQHWSSAHGRIKGRKIPRMPFNTIVLSAEISDDAKTLTWSNSVTWSRVEPRAAGDAKPADAAAEAEGNAGEAGDPTAEGGAPSPPEQPSSTAAAAAAKGAAEGGGAEPTGGASAAGSTEALQKQLRDAQRQHEDEVARTDAKQKSLKKELMSCREQTMALQTSLEQRDQYIAVLYCVIGVLVVSVCFLGCRGMGSADADGAEEEEEEWASERHLKSRAALSTTNSSATLAKAL